MWRCSFFSSASLIFMCSRLGVMEEGSGRGDGILGSSWTSGWEKDIQGSSSSSSFSLIASGVIERITCFLVDAGFYALEDF